MSYGLKEIRTNSRPKYSSSAVVLPLMSIGVSLAGINSNFLLVWSGGCWLPSGQIPTVTPFARHCTRPVEKKKVTHFITPYDITKNQERLRVHDRWNKNFWVFSYKRHYIISYPAYLLNRHFLASLSIPCLWP